MKPITEARRQELIASCKIEIEISERAIKRIEAQKTDFDLTREKSHLARQRIALVSLTAEPTHYVFNHPNGKLFNAVVDESCKGHKDVRPGYTAPPVPVIKFPNPHDIPDGYDLDSCMATVQWYQSEVKRLNGLG